ncbi:hypothetical protein NQ317_015197 [Molorchus minor]|uniref:Androgen-dependent TFPI-regulating protein-like n=1 Tax=Molorchus minor TaxID=1323400 RepID=A0ABQ9JN19_9CUCU|nr:hypothetical protein NQ317_015197 [Molorchus minor]
MLRLFHILAILHYVYAVWYDLNYVHIPILSQSTGLNIPMKGRLKFLTFWDVKCGSKMLHLIFHLISASVFLGTFWYDQMYLDIPFLQWEHDKFMKGRLKFLTLWNMLLQGFFFTICLLNDVIGTNEASPKRKPFIRKFKDVLLASLAFPLSMFVGLTFWGLYFVDRELIFPRALDPYFPTWLNHVMHTNIMLFILLEMYTSFREYPARKKGVGILVLFMAVYLVWIHIINSYTGMWVYPILDVLNLPLRIIFFVALLGFIVVLYILGEKLNALIWRRQLKVLKLS